jgi:hypothetical protein
MDQRGVIGGPTSGRCRRLAARRSARRPLAAGTVLVAALGLAAAACGGGSSSTSSNTTTTSGGSSSGIATSYTSTVNAKSAHMALTLGVVEPGRAAVNITGTGAASFGTDQSEFSLDIPQAGTFQVRLVGGTLYLMVPPQAQVATGGKPWASVDLSSLQPGNSTVPGLGTGSSDPSQILGYLQGVSSSVTNLGPATVRGVPRTHYRAVIDLNKAAQANPQAAAQYQKLVSQIHTSTLPVDVWTDSSNRVNQMRFQIPVPPAGGGSTTGGTVTLTLQLFDFGAPVTVTAPPADQVGQLNIPTTTATP